MLAKFTWQLAEKVHSKPMGVTASFSHASAGFRNSDKIQIEFGEEFSKVADRLPPEVVTTRQVIWQCWKQLGLVRSIKYLIGYTKPDYDTLGDHDVINEM